MVETTQQRRGPLLDHLDEIEAKCLKGDPSFQEIFDVFGSDGHYVLITFLIVPFLQPVPLVGLSTPFGILIAAITALAYFRKPPWLPKRWREKKLPAKTISRIAEGSERIFEKVEKAVRPRWPVFFQEPFRTVSAILLFSNAILLALPLPIPFSNAFPAWMIAFHGLAQLEDDGLFVVVSYVQTILCVIYFLSLAKGADAGFKALGF